MAEDPAARLEAGDVALPRNREAPAEVPDGEGRTPGTEAPEMSPLEFIAKWRAADLKERSAAQEHFIDLCRVLGEPTPAEADPVGERYCFEKGARKESGGGGWADVWKRGCFAWEYKTPGANLEEAFAQLRQYAFALENPPLLIVSDIARFRIHTSWTNTVGETHEFSLEDLAAPATLQKLKWAFSSPERLRPGETRQELTERAAGAFAKLAWSLRERGENAQEVAHFVNRLVFCMFAEDVGLLPDRMFQRMLEQAESRPEEFVTLARTLFGAMATGGQVGFERVEWFNGGLFENDAALPLDRAQIRMAIDAARLDWSEIDPSIFGTLFERGLDPDKRAQLGAHYTDRDKIMRIVEPVIVRPWLEEWERTRAGIEAALGETGARTDSRRRKMGRQKKAESLLREFLARLRSFTVLDPACGSGNFLYLALHALKDLEQRVQVDAERFGLRRSFPEIGPANVRGIELNTYAAELARVAIWIGDIQWMRRNGFRGSKDPVLRPLETIECRDAVLGPDGRVPEWPEADVVIGNPPFLGNRRMRSELGDAYVEGLAHAYRDEVEGKPDLVCYWFARAGRLMADGRLARAGLVATNSIRGGTNRKVLDRILEHADIYDAWDDEPWVVDGTAVRVSLICFAPQEKELPVALDGRAVARIGADLSAAAADLTRARRLERNRGVAFQGDIKRGPFDIPGSLAREWLRLPANPNGRPNADVLRPWLNGRDLARRPSDRWIIDFGCTMGVKDACQYEAPFRYVDEHVRPVREKTREPASREYWFRHWNPRPAMRDALAGLSRCILTPRVAKHRVFVWRDARICPDSAVVAIAREDDVTFGILHSRFHEAWSLRLGTSLGKGNDPRYTPTTTFETFPFPEGLSPKAPATERDAHPGAATIGEAARRLDVLRRRWLYPEEWVEWTEEPVPGYPKRPVPRGPEAEKGLEGRTLTNLYNEAPAWLMDAHADLDAAVAAAYGWPEDIAEDGALADLLERNLAQREDSLPL